MAGRMEARSTRAGGGFLTLFSSSASSLGRHPQSTIFPTQISLLLL
jgi:hypothetical protein